MEGAKPLPRPPQRAKSPNDTKRSGRAAKTSRWDVLAKGNPIKGFPAGRSPAKNAQTITAPARRNDKRFDSLARFFALGKLEMRHAAISTKLRPRGHPRAACGPPFLLFGLRPRRNGVGFRPLRRARRALPSTCQPFEKGWTENFLVLAGRRDSPRAASIVAAQPVARLTELGAKY